MMPSSGRLRWQCRRGTLEMDILLERYLDQRFESAAAEEQAAFIELLRLEDSQLQPYLMGERTPDDARLSDIVGKIRQL
ncbi:MAG: FAD assembly factor SdhE [Gammaproteobacteria bacterium]